jgi:hypothetical protein
MNEQAEREEDHRGADEAARPHIFSSELEIKMEKSE